MSAPVHVLAGGRMADTNTVLPGQDVDIHITDGLITQVTVHTGTVTGPGVLDCRGLTVMPGLIDAHWHAAFAALPAATAANADPGYLHAVATAQAHQTLLRGFTTVRDCGGPVFGLKQAIDEQHVPGPRIHPAGAMVSQTGGHGDFRHRWQVPADPCRHLHIETLGAARIADGTTEVLRAVREQLMLGASHVKVMAGGGVASAYDPLDVTQYTLAEMRAAVDAAGNWGTYVTVHAYTPAAIAQAVQAGVRCIEHGHLADEGTVALMAQQGVWWSLQPFLDDQDAIPMASAASRAKQQQVVDGTDRAFALAAKHGVRVAFGTDTLFDAKLATRQGIQLAKLTRWMGDADVVRMATRANADLLELAGARNPYPAGVGDLAPGRYADVLAVAGDPCRDVSLLADTGNLRVIVKDGTVVKDTRG